MTDITDRIIAALRAASESSTTNIAMPLT